MRFHLRADCYQPASASLYANVHNQLPTRTENERPGVPDLRPAAYWGALPGEGGEYYPWAGAVNLCAGGDRPGPAPLHLSHSALPPFRSRARYAQRTYRRHGTGSARSTSAP